MDKAGAYDLVAALAFACREGSPKGSQVSLAVPKVIHRLFLNDRRATHAPLTPDGAVMVQDCRIVVSYINEFHATASIGGEVFDLEFKVDPIKQLLAEAGVNWL